MSARRFSWSEIKWVEIEPDPQAGQLLEALAALDRVNDPTPPEPVHLPGDDR